jgi:hypothetical protein
MKNSLIKPKKDIGVLTKEEKCDMVFCSKIGRTISAYYFRKPGGESSMLLLSREKARRIIKWANSGLPDFVHRHDGRDTHQRLAAGHCVHASRFSGINPGHARSKGGFLITKKGMITNWLRIYKYTNIDLTISFVYSYIRDNSQFIPPPTTSPADGIGRQKEMP